MLYHALILQLIFLQKITKPGFENSSLIQDLFLIFKKMNFIKNRIHTFFNFNFFQKFDFSKKYSHFINFSFVF